MRSLAPGAPVSLSAKPVVAAPVLEANGLLDVEFLKIAVFGVAFELGQRGCGSINGMLAKAVSPLSGK